MRHLASKFPCLPAPPALLMLFLIQYFSTCCTNVTSLNQPRSMSLSLESLGSEKSSRAKDLNWFSSYTRLLSEYLKISISRETFLYGLAFEFRICCFWCNRILLLHYLIITLYHLNMKINKLLYLVRENIVLNSLNVPERYEKFLRVSTSPRKNPYLHLLAGEIGQRCKELMAERNE